MISPKRHINEFITEVLKRNLDRRGIEKECHREKLEAMSGPKDRYVELLNGLMGSVELGRPADGLYPHEVPLMRPVIEYLISRGELGPSAIKGF